MTITSAAFNSRTGRGIALALFSLPGLLGPLVLSLAILGLFQLPGFRVLSESLVPLILALVLFVLPRAVILFAVAGITRRTQSAHCAWMLVASPEAAQRRTGAAPALPQNRRAALQKPGADRSDCASAGTHA